MVTASETANEPELKKIDALIGLLDVAVGDVMKTQPGFVAAAISQQPAYPYQVAKLEGAAETPVLMYTGSGQQMRPYAPLKKKSALAIPVRVVADRRQCSHIDKAVVVPVRAAPLPPADGKFQNGGNLGRPEEPPRGLQR